MYSPTRSRIFLLFALVFALSACSSISGLSIFPGVHKLDRQQGNIIDQEKLDQLEVGLTKAQAQFVMGTPLISDTFDLDRWDYVYQFLSASGLVLERSVTLQFDGNLLEAIEGDHDIDEPSATDQESSAEN
jgi:outer membrane protein assembly factor BamE